jgi:hypothetical protein
MSRYSRPKRNVQNFNADNFEASLIETTNDVLKITSQETSSKFGFYTIPEVVYTNQPKIAGFVSNNNINKIIDENMKFVNSGSYHIRLSVTMRPSIDVTLNLVCNLSPLQQFFKLQTGVYNQVILDTLVYATSGDELFYQILNTKGQVFETEYNLLRLVNTVMSVQLISSQNVLV